MSTFAMKKKLKAEIAAAKKAGKSMQTVGKLQYKLNQISKDSKGTAVKTKTGVLKSKTGVVRQKDATKKKRKPAVKKAGGKMSDLVYDKPKSNVTVTPYKTAKIKKIDVSQAVNRDQARGNKVDVTKGGSVVRKRNKKPVLTEGGSVVRKRNEKY